MGQEERPPNEADRDRIQREQTERAQREQDLKGPAQAEAARRVREEGRGQRRQERKRLSTEESGRELARFIQQNVVLQQATSQDELDRLRVSMGDEQHEAHIAVREYHRALANHRGHPNTPAGSLALQKEIDDARKAVEDNPLAKAQLEKIERARRRNEPVDLTTDEEA